MVRNVLTAMGLVMLAGCGERQTLLAGGRADLGEAPGEAVRVASATAPRVETPPVAAAPAAVAHEDPGRIDHLGRARLLEAEGDLEGALVEARRAAFDRPRDREPWRAVSRLARRLNRSALEKLALAAEAETAPADALPLLRLARLELGDRDAAGALLHASEAGRRAPENAEAWQLCGRARLDLGRPAEAAADFRKAVELSPEHAWAWNNLGFALLLSGDAAGAVLPLERAAVLAPRLAYVRNNLGLAYERAGRAVDARDQFAQALDLDPGHPTAGESLRRAVAKAREEEDLPEGGLVEVEPGALDGEAASSNGGQIVILDLATRAGADEPTGADAEQALEGAHAPELAHRAAGESAGR